MSARGTTIWGSSSRGVRHRAANPRIDASKIRISDKFESRKTRTILFVTCSCSGMAGPTGRNLNDWDLDLLSLAQPGQDFDILTDLPSQSNGPPADGPLRW